MSKPRVVWGLSAGQRPQFHLSRHRHSIDQRFNQSNRMKTKNTPKPTPEIRRIKDLPENVSLANVRFRYPGDGKSYYWYSQWTKGVWGKKDINSGQMFPLFCDSIEEALEWEVVES